jgi:hypothetical protein
MNDSLIPTKTELSAIYYGTSTLSPQKPTIDNSSPLDKSDRKVSTVAFTTNKKERMDIIALNIVCVCIFLYLLNNVFTTISTIKNPDLKQKLHKYNIILLILLISLNLLFLYNKNNLTYVLVMNILVYIVMTYTIRVNYITY